MSRNLGSNTHNLGSNTHNLGRNVRNREKFAASIEKSSAKLEELFNEHMDKIPSLVQEIQDLTVQERNDLKERLDVLIHQATLIENEIEVLRARSERVYIKADNLEQMRIIDKK